MNPTQPVAGICQAYAAGHQRGLAYDDTHIGHLERMVQVYVNEELKAAFRLGFVGGQARSRELSDDPQNPEIQRALNASLQSYQEGVRDVARILIDDSMGVEAIALDVETSERYRSQVGMPYCDAFDAIVLVMQRMLATRGGALDRLRRARGVADGSTRATPIVFATRTDGYHA